MALLSLVLPSGCRPKSIFRRPYEVFDAGAVFASTTPTLTHVFHIENTTKRPVKIKSENHSCDCTTVKLSKRTLSPGEPITLTLSVNVPTAYVKKDVAVKLDTDDPEHPDWEYHLRFEAFPDAQVVPQVIDLGSYTVAEMLMPESAGDTIEPEAWLEVFTAADGKARGVPKLIQVPTDCIVTMEQAPHVYRPATGVRAERYRISIRLKKGIPSTGTFVRPLNVGLGDERGASASFTWCVRAPVVSAPERIHFGSVSTDDPPIDRSIDLRAADGMPFRILSVDHDATVTVRPASRSGFPTDASSQHHLGLVFQVPCKETARFLVGKIRIRIDRRDYPEVAIPWSAIFQTGRSNSSPRHGESAVVGY
ncbi:MAG: DUF1573 domain-containing protein [Isosphaeraceae bacterium]